MNEVFDTGTKVSSSSPNVFDEGDLLRVDFEFLSEPAIIELDAFLLEKDVFIGSIENLDTKHHKARVMTTSQSDVIQVVEPHAKLRADQRISRRVEFACHTVGLEAKDTSCHVVDVVTPACHHWISFNRLAGNPRRGQRPFESLPSFRIGDFSSCRTDAAALSNEGILAYATTSQISYIELLQVSRFSVLRQ